MSLELRSTIRPRETFGNPPNGLSLLERLHCALIHIHMQIAKMKDYKSIKRLRNFGQPDVVVPHFDLGGVSATAPI